LATSITIIALFFGANTTAVKTHHTHHHVGPAVHHVHKHRHHKRKQTTNGHITTFDLCVANRENGEPGSLRFSDVNWHAVNEYYGAYSFLHETWRAAGGERFAYNANEATPDEQSQVFNSYSARDPGAWPNTIPPCLGYM
jgi:hypothetical protein